MAILLIIVFVLVWFAIVAGATLSMPVLTNFFPGQEGMTIVCIINLLFTIGIPLMAAVLLIIRVVFRRSIHTGWWVGLGAFWLINAISLAGIGGKLGQEFVTEDYITENVDINASTNGSDTLKLSYYKMANTSKRRLGFGGDDIELPGAGVHFHIAKSSNNEWTLEKRVRARARTDQAARTLASGLQVPLKQNQGALAAPREIPFDKIQKWRDQDVKLTVYAPVGAYLRLDRNNVGASYVVDHAPSHKLRDTELYQMLANGSLQCITCPAIDTETSNNVPTADETLGLISAGGYDGVRISGPLKVTIEQGDEFEVRMNGPQTYLNRLEQEIADGTLKLNLDAERTSRPVRIYLTMPNLSSLKIEGTDDIRLKNIQSPELSIEASSRSAIKLDGDIGQLAIRLLDVAELEFTGTADHLRAELRDVSRLDADRGTVQTAELDLKNQSRAKLQQTVDIQAQSVSKGSRLRLVD